jgi:outer membrane protein assembly factor BamB
MKTILALLLLVVVYTGWAQQGDFKSSGIDDIDQIRREVKNQPTTAENTIHRRSALYRWWRLLWHQGYDMDAFDDVAEILLNLRDSTLNGQRAITEGFLKLEEMVRIGKKIPEIRGKNSTKSSTITNWPLYHGTDATQTGYSPDEGPSTGKIAWKFPKSYGCEISPLIDSGRVYIPGVGDDVVAYSLDEVTGNVIWKGRKYGSEYYHNIGLNNSAMLTGNRMLVKTGAGLKMFEKTTGKFIPQGKLSKEISSQKTIYPKILKQGLNHFSCINAQTGKIIRRFRSPDKISGQPVLFNNYVFYITYDGTLHAVSLDEKDKKWQKNYKQILDGFLSVNEDGTLYLGTNEGYLLAVNSRNGNLKWSFYTKHIEPRSQQLFSEVLISGDRLYLGSANKTVYCLNTNTGDLNWEYQVDDWVRSKPIFVDEYLYVATLSGKMYAIKDNSKSAQLIWQTKVAEHGFTANINGSRNGILGVSQNQMLYSVSAKTGKVQWRHGLLDGMFIDENFYASEELGGQQSSPVVVDGVMYIGGTDGFVNAIDVESGKEKWRFETDGVMASSPTVAFDKVFFGEAYNANGTYYALDKETGEPVWKSEAYGKVWVNATFDDKHIYFGNMEGYFFAVNPNNGKMIWQYNTAKDTHLKNMTPNMKLQHGHGFPPGVYCNPVYKNGVVYTGSWAGYYFAFDQNTGKLKWRTKTQSQDFGGLPDSSAPVLYKNHLYVQKGGWQIAAINIETGLIDWEWSAPLGYLQNGTVTAFNNKIFGSIIRSVSSIPYDASIIAFSDVENGGKELWRYEGGGGLTAAVATNDKLIFGSSGDVFITCLNPDNGEVKWRTYTGGMMLESVPAIYGNKAFAQCKNGYIYAFE